jgi:hypothetical protein
VLHEVQIENLAVVYHFEPSRLQKWPQIGFPLTTTISIHCKHYGSDNQRLTSGGHAVCVHSTGLRLNLHTIGKTLGISHRLCAIPAYHIGARGTLLKIQTTPKYIPVQSFPPFPAARSQQLLPLTTPRVLQLVPIEGIVMEARAKGRRQVAALGKDTVPSGN